MLWRKYRKIYYLLLLITYYLSVSIGKELDNGKTVMYKIKFIDSFRFMSTSPSSFVDNLSEIYKKECKGCRERKTIKSVCDFIGLKNNKL